MGRAQWAARTWRRHVLAAPLATALLAAALVVSLSVAEAPAVWAAQPPQPKSTLGTVPDQPSDLHDPSDVAVGGNGEVYAADTAANVDAIVVFDRDGTFLRRWPVLSDRIVAASPVDDHLFTAQGCNVLEYTPLGAEVRRFGSCGSGAGQFGSIKGVAIGADGTIYVADTYRIEAFDPSGAFLRSWGTSSTFPRLVDLEISPSGSILALDSARKQVLEFSGAGDPIRTWGTSGNGAGQLRNPHGITVGPNGDVYVSDDVARVQRFTSSGQFVGQWGGAGEDPGQFTYPAALDAASSGEVFVVDSTNDRIERFSASGAFEVEWGTWTVPGRLRSAWGLARLPSGDVLVTDAARDEVMVFDSGGTYLRSWATTSDGGTLLRPSGVAVDGAGDVFVVDRAHARIQRYDAEGHPVAAWGDGQLSDPTWLALDGLGQVYVTDAGTRQVRVFTTEGAFLRSWDAPPSGSNTTHLGGLVVAPNGDVLVAADSVYEDRVARFTPDGTLVSSIGSHGSGDGQFEHPNGLALDGAGNLYVTDDGYQRVVMFDADDQPVTTWRVSSDHLQGVAAWGRKVLVAAPSQVSVFKYPTRPAARVTVSTADDRVTAPVSVSFHVVVDNLGGVPLTGVRMTSVSVPGCARRLADIPVGGSATFDCTRALTGRDAGTLSVAVTMQSAETRADSPPIAVDVAAFGEPTFVRRWTASRTGLGDSSRLFRQNYERDDLPGLDDVRAMATDRSGDVYVVGYDDGRAGIRRFDRDGILEAEWGSGGDGPGQLDHPSGIAVAPNGDVYTTECGTGRIQRFSPSGVVTGSWVEPRNGASHDTCSPVDVAVGPYGKVYVLDAANGRVDTIKGDTYRRGWGRFGTAPGQFDDPRAIAVGPDGTVYVADFGSGLVNRFSSRGTFLGAFGGRSGIHNGDFTHPRDVAVDETGKVYVAVLSGWGQGHETRVFRSDGRFLSTWNLPTTDLAVHTEADRSTHVYLVRWPDTVTEDVVREYVSRPVGLVTAALSPRDDDVVAGTAVQYDLAIRNVGTVPLTSVTVDPQGLAGCGGPTADLAVGEQRRLTCTRQVVQSEVGRVHQRVAVDTAQTPAEPSDNTGVAVLSQPLATMGGTGSGPGQLSSPDGIATTWAGDLFVADCGNHEVARFSKDGQFVTAWGEQRLSCPTDVTVTADGRVLVLDRDLRQVLEFEGDGTFVRSWATRTTTEGTPVGLDVDDAGNVYVTDFQPLVEHCYQGPPPDYQWLCEYRRPPDNNLTRRFDRAGQFLGQWEIAQKGRIWIDSAGVLHLDLLEFDPLTGERIGEIPPCPQCTGSGSDVAVDRFGNDWLVESSGDLLWFAGDSSLGNPILGQWDIGATAVTVDHDHVFVVTDQDTVLELALPTG